MFVRESGHTLRETILVRPSELGGYVRLAARVRDFAPGGRPASEAGAVDGFARPDRLR